MGGYERKGLYVGIKGNALEAHMYDDDRVEGTRFKTSIPITAGRFGDPRAYVRTRDQALVELAEKLFDKDINIDSNCIAPILDSSYESLNEDDWGNLCFTFDVYREQNL